MAGQLLRDPIWKRMFFWPEAHWKVLFGTDVHFADFDTAIERQQNVFDSAGWDAEEQAVVYAGNPERIFGLG